MGTSEGALLDDRRCFACGPENEHGLGLRFHYSDGTAHCHYTAGERFGGWAGMLHGGVVATMLDEAMAHAALARGMHAVTARLEVRFRRPAPTGVSLLLEGIVTGRRGRALDLAATLSDGAGCVYAEGHGRFIAEPLTDRAAHPARE